MILACSGFLSTFVGTIYRDLVSVYPQIEKNVFKKVIFEKEHLPSVSPKLILSNCLDV